MKVQSQSWDGSLPAQKGSFTRAILEALAEEYQFSLDTPFEDYPEEIQNILIHGTNGTECECALLWTARRRVSTILHLKVLLRM